jgi:hypothetical protein
MFPVLNARFGIATPVKLKHNHSQANQQRKKVTDFNQQRQQTWRGTAV